MLEEWRDVIGYEGLYQVSYYGQVKRLANTPRCKTERILKLFNNPSGYPFVVLSANGKTKSLMVHRLVATAFMGACPVGFEVNHKDGNKENNFISNLEYVTRGENNTHAFQVLHRTPIRSGGAKGESNHNAILTENAVISIRRLYKMGVKNGELAKLYGVSPSRITRIVQRKQWKHIED